MSPNRQLAVVSGASSGIGRATVRVLAARGFHVLAGVRRQADADELAGGSDEPVILDITDAAQVAAIAWPQRTSSPAECPATSRSATAT